MVKKLTLIVFILMITMLIIPIEIFATSEIMLGDINDDQKIDSRDVLIELRHIFAVQNNKHQDWILKNDKLKIADVNEDKEINTADVLIMQRYIVANNNINIGKKHPDWLKLKTIKKIDATKIEINKASTSIDVNTTEMLLANISPSNATAEKIEWNSSDNKVATVERITTDQTFEGIDKNKYEFINIGNGYYIIRIKNTMNVLETEEIKKLDTSDGKIATFSNRKVTENSFNGKDNQIWKIEEAENGYYKIKSKDSGMYLDESEEELAIRSKDGNSSSGESKKILKVRIFKNDKSQIFKLNKINSIETIGIARIKAVKNGTALITATSKNGKKATCKVTVITSPKSIKLNKSSISLDLSGTKTATITATIEPSNATNKEVTWTSSNTKVATVDKNGKVNAKANGTTTITAQTKLNNKKATCKITVTTSPKLIKLDKTSYTLDIGKKLTLKATIEPTTSSNKKVTWTTSNSSVAGVSNGIVTAKKTGTAKITAKTSNGKTATCNITVKNQKITGGQAIAESAVKLACSVAVAPDQNRYTVARPNSRVYNSRTAEYINAREKLIKGKVSDGGDYASCDIAVATAVRYSKVDINMGYDTISKIWQYLRNSNQWKSVGEYKRPNSPTNLKPGDVLISGDPYYGHIMIYTGNKAVRKKYPKSDADAYEAGYSTTLNDSYYPRLFSITKDTRNHIGFTVFRNINWDKLKYDKIL